ncbi:MAG: hypothetical protein JF593_07170 [Novosphingobium sp.]|nr:hypothetical protein [Novosphingobium sp.]
MKRAPACPAVPVSWGELLDKIAILEIKRARIRDLAARAHVATELRLLSEIAMPVLDCPGVAPLCARLRTINAALWEIEDTIRKREAAGDFAAEFVRLARAVYHTNDERAAVKRELNLLLESTLIEEKSYADPNPGMARRA